MAKAIVIGAGIIGLSSAYYLQEEGWEVVVLEKGDLRNNCSFGNMGYLSPSHFVPLASPGIISQGLLWMFSQKSPFYIRPVPSMALIDWGLKFARSATADNVERGARPLVDILMLSRTLFEQWDAAGDMKFELEKKGCINWFQTEKKKKGELETVEQGRKMGLDIEIISREKALEMEPSARPDVLGGAWYKDDEHLNPNALMRELPALLERRGVKILRNTEVTGFERQNGQIKAVRTGEQRHEADLVVLAAGSWSPLVAKLAGEKMALMPGKGYSLTVDNPATKLNYPCIFLEAKVAMTPWKNRLRIGSTMEIGAINDRILFPRVQGILEAVPRFMPGYLDDPVFRELADFEKLERQMREKVWFGFRPVTPDGLPYIGFSKKHKNLLLATGHAMLGLSMGAGTGKLVAELATGKPTSISVAAFAPERF